MRGHIATVGFVPALCCACFADRAAQREGATRAPCPKLTSHATPPTPVRATLVDCETVQPIEFEQVQPNGQVFTDGYADPEPMRVRLHLRLENTAGHDLLVGTCDGELLV